MADLTSALDWFKDDGIFLPMLNDGGRNNFYKKAIDKIARGKIIADVGAGTGLLSVLAAKIGATKVYAIEKDLNRYEYLKAMIDQIGLADRIQTIHADFLDTDIQADFYVSETINTQIFGENILALANHAVRYGGRFIPGSFEIIPAIYEHHPIFILDQSQPDACRFDPKIEISEVFNSKIQQDLLTRHPLHTTLHRANQLNKLFTLLPQFKDVKLNQLWQGNGFVLDLNRPTDPESIAMQIDTSSVGHDDKNWYLVLFWRARFLDVSMHSNDVWFGNVSKSLMKTERRLSQISIQWQPSIKDWSILF